MTKVSANPVELAIAAAFLGGQLAAKDVETFAAQTAAALEAGGIDPGQWREAAAKWSGAEQNVAWRTQASDLLKQNRAALEQLATAIEHVARLPVVAPTQAVIGDWMMQLGFDGHRKLEPSAIASHTSFLEKGRFARLPGHLVPPAQIEVGDKRAAKIDIPIDRKLLEHPMGAALSKAMDQQWSFLHERGAEGFINPNTLTRYTYNQFAVRQILDHLEAKNVRDGRVLLVTGYETPIHELLESNRVKEVVVADLSANAAKMLAEKYAHHPNARKLKIEIKDFSGLDLETQQRALEKVGDPQAYFTEVASNLVPVDYASGTFDAVHLPFVAGSFHLGAATVEASKQKEGHADLEVFFGAETLATKTAQDALVRTDRHVLDEARRITKQGGLVVTEMWARPSNNESAPIRFSDTPITRDAFDHIVAGWEHWFSGNPQPGLPHTVGHVFGLINS